MKKSLLILTVLGGILMSGCVKNDTPANNPDNGETYRGIVIKNVCCQIAIQTFGTKSLGESWIDADNSAMPVYTNSFKVANPCDFGNHVKGDTINFKIVGTTAQNCACCALYANLPATNYPVKVVN